MDNKPRLIGGPADGLTVSGRSKHTVGIPLDENLNPLKSKDEPYAFAIYKLNAAGDYAFHSAQRKESEKPFSVEFLGGPMEGTRPFAAPIQLYEKTWCLPLDAEHKPLDQGAKVAAVAEYKRKSVDGIWKMEFVRIVDDPKEAENFSDMLAEHQLTQELQTYTTEQLVNQLLSRQGFVGVILMYPGELVGKWHLKKGDTLAIGIGKQLNVDNAKLIISSALESLEKR
jgi:hypothetical protein